MSYYIGATGEYIWEELLDNATSNVVISNHINFDATPLTDAIQQTITDNLGTALGELIQTPTQVASATGVGVISLTALGLLSYYKLNRTAVQDVDSMVYSADYASILTPGMFDDRVRIRYDTNYFSNAFYYVGGIKKGEILTSRINLLPVNNNNIDLYTATGKIGIGTATPLIPLHIYNATDANIRLETGASGTASIDFQRGTISDVNVDFRITNDAGRLKILSQDEVNLYTATTSEIVRFTRTLMTNYKDLYNLGNVSIGLGLDATYPSQLRVYNSTNTILRLETDTTGKASIEFQRGAFNDANVDYRIINEGDLFKIQSQNATNLYTAGTMELIRISPTLTTNYKDFLNNGAFNNLGNVNISTTAGTSSYKLNVEGDVNIAGIGKMFYVNNSPVVSSQWTTAGTTIEYNGGSVGIGSFASHKLNVGGTINADGLITSVGLTSSALITANAGLTIATGQTLTLSGTAGITAGGLITANGGITTSATSLITANNGITIATGKTLTLSGTAGITAGGLITANGGITIATGQTLTLSGTANISANTMTASGLITATGGITTGATGTITANGGIIIPSGKYLSVGTTTTSDVDDNTSFAIPLAPLYVKGGATTGGTCDVVFRGGVAGQNNGKTKLWLASDASHSAYIQGEHISSGNTNLTFGTASGNALPTERMRIDQSGNVGIGNTAPLGLLHLGDASKANNDGHIIFAKCTTLGSTRICRVGYNNSFEFVIGDIGGGNTLSTWAEQFKIHYTAPNGSFYINNSGHTTASYNLNVGSDLAVGGTSYQRNTYIYSVNEWSSIGLYFATPFTGGVGSATKSAIIAEAQGTYSRHNLAFCLNGTASNSENVSTANVFMRLNYTGYVQVYKPFIVYNEVYGGFYSVTNSYTDYVCVQGDYGGNNAYGERWLKIAYGSFTAFHRCYTDDELYNNDTQENIDLFKNDYVGRVVIATGKIKSDFTRTTKVPDDPNEPNDPNEPINKPQRENNEWYSEIDKDGITAEDAVPIVRLSRQRKDKRVFGVLGAPKRNTNNPNRLIVNSVGEGGICVSNTNGNIENGDYIQSSDLLGYGEKQDDDLLHNYTIAKATIDCNFELDSPYYQCHEIENGVRVAFIACSYHCG